RLAAAAEGVNQAAVPTILDHGDLIDAAVDGAGFDADDEGNPGCGAIDHLRIGGYRLRIGKRVQFLVRAAVHVVNARGDRAVRVERRAERAAALQLELVRPADEG